MRIGKCVRIRNPENVSIGDNSIINDFTYISSNLELGKYFYIAFRIDKIASWLGSYLGSVSYDNLRQLRKAKKVHFFFRVSTQNPVIMRPKVQPSVYHR